jgi:hypothetical protein
MAAMSHLVAWFVLTGCGKRTYRSVQYIDIV